jgi:lipoprotein-releasing system permease protein
MTVTQKRQDIAILRSMGYDTFDVVMLFFSQGLILGISGAALGLLVGYSLCLYLQTLSFSSPIMPASHLQISLSFWIYAQAAALALVSSSLASILPARAAGRLTPIEIIRAGG